jgi:hypothetical protein
MVTHFRAMKIWYFRNLKVLPLIAITRFRFYNLLKIGALKNNFERFIARTL